jgi:hypothetical protein
VLAAIGRPWTPSGGIRRGDDVGAFAAPGYAKMGMDLRGEPGRLVTETRVELTDERARRLFRPYWLLVKPFSILIRRLWLRAALKRLSRDSDGMRTS